LTAPFTDVSGRRCFAHSAPITRFSSGNQAKDRFELVIADFVGTFFQTVHAVDQRRARISQFDLSVWQQRLQLLNSQQVWPASGLCLCRNRPVNCRKVIGHTTGGHQKAGANKKVSHCRIQKIPPPSADRSYYILWGFGITRKQASTLCGTIFLLGCRN
jgi:hypothetical protein